MYLGYKEIIKKSLPVMFSYFFIGFNFGVLFKNLGGTPFQSFIISTFTFAGAAQYVSLEYFIKPSMFFLMFITILFINMRHVIYVSTSLHRFGASKLKKIYLVSALTDENYGMLELYDSKFLTPNNLIRIFAINQMYWVLGCTLGASLNLDKINVKGLDFCLTCMFVIILVSKLQALKKG